MGKFCYLEDLSVDRLMSYAADISRWERLSGSEEELAAFRYMEEKLRSFGYETRLVFHDAYISLPVSSLLLADGAEIPSRTHSMVVTTPPGGVEGKVVFLTESELKAGAAGSLWGNILALEGRAVFSKAKEAERLGAAGLICIQEEPVRECIPSAAWGSPDRFCEGLYPKLPILSISDQYGGAVLKKENCTVHMETVTDTGWRKIPSLTAELRAPANTEDFVMFSGHLDSWYHGAIDNGTVNAAQLEIARTAARYKGRLKRNLCIVNFSGHSHGRYAGSAWYADANWLWLREHCVVNVNADSIGGKNASDLTRSMMMPETKELACEIIKALTGVDFKGIRCKRAADQSFWGCGVSSAFASFSRQPKVQMEDGSLSVGRGNADLGWWWHTPQDTMEQVDPACFKRDASIFCAYIMEFLTRDVLPLNFLKTAEEIKEALEEWAVKAKGFFDLSQELEMACQLLESVRHFPFGQAEHNRTALELGRILVPLLHTTGDLYRNDSAEEYPKMPALALLDQLVKLEEGSDPALKLHVELMHKRNFVADSLNRGIRLLQKGGSV